MAGLELLRHRVDGEDLLGDGAGAAEVGDGRAVHLAARDLGVVLHELDAVGAVSAHTAVVDPRKTRRRVHVDADTWPHWHMLQFRLDQKPILEIKSTTYWVFLFHIFGVKYGTKLSIMSRFLFIILASDILLTHNTRTENTLVDWPKRTVSLSTSPEL